MGELFDKNQENIKREAKERQEEKPINILEIGSGAIPFVSEGKLKEGDNYYIIEINERDFEYLKNILELGKKAKKVVRKENIYPLLGDGKNLPFEKGTMDKVFFSNVFGDPGILKEDKICMLEEARRVLKDDGLLIIKEDTCPLNIGTLVEMVEKMDFILEKKIDTPSEWQREVSLYHKGPLARYLPHAYIVYFRKKLKELNI